MGGDDVEMGRWRAAGFLPHPTLSRRERARGLAPFWGVLSVNPTAWSFRPCPSVIPTCIPSFPHPLTPSFPPASRHSRRPLHRHSRPSYRHSRESGNPRPGLASRPVRLPGFWIPACAGMTVGGGTGRWRPARRSSCDQLRMNGYLNVGRVGYLNVGRVGYLRWGDWLPAPRGLATCAGGIGYLRWGDWLPAPPGFVCWRVRFRLLRGLS